MSSWIYPESVFPNFIRYCSKLVPSLCQPFCQSGAPQAFGIGTCQDIQKICQKICPDIA